MRFTSLSVENFKAFEREYFALSPGFTVVRGLNEAGKSSIQAAILTALFLDPAAANVSLDANIRWGQDCRPRLQIGFEAQGTAYTLEKDFEAGTTLLRWVGSGADAGGTTHDVHEAHRIVGIHLGSFSMDTYVNTACIRSDEVSKLPAAASTVSHRLQAKVTSGRQASAADVLAKIDVDLASLVTGGPRRAHETGPLRLSRERVDALQRRRIAANEDLAAYSAHIVELQRLRRDLSAIECDSRVWTQLIERSDKAQTLEEDIALLEEHQRDMKSAAVLRESVGHAAEELSGVGYETVADSLVRAQTMERQLHRHKLRESEINHQLAVLVLTRLQNRPRLSRTVIAWAGLALSVASAGLAIAAQLPELFGGIVAGLALLAVAFWTRRSSELDSTSSYSHELAQCVEAIRHAEGELQRLLAGYRLRSVEELATVAREMRNSGDTRVSRLERIQHLLGEQRTMDHERAYDALTHAIAERKKAFENLAGDRLPAADYEHADSTLQSLVGKREGLQRQMYRLEGELGTNNASSEALATIDEELAAEQVKLARLERRRRALEYSRALLQQALADTLSQVSTVFRTGVSRHLGPITGGRYTRVDAEIEENGLRLAVYTADGRKAVQADSLSRATQDQIYLAARMALLDLVSEGRQPPILLDDPFVNYDDDRVANTLTLMKDLYRDHQVVLFTCVDRYDTFADTVITLRGPDLAAQLPTQIAAS